MPLPDLVRFVKDINGMDLIHALENREAEGVRMYLVAVEETLKAAGYDNVWVATCVSRLLMGTYLKGTFYDEGNEDLADELRLFYGGIAEETIQALYAVRGDVSAL